MNEKFDVVVIGSGPGGYVAAIRAAQLGARVAVIEKSETGGTCLNRGCIPAKAFVASANALLKVKNAVNFGILAEKYDVDFHAIVERKNKIVRQSRSGVELMFKMHKITLIKGSASFAGADKLEITGESGVSIVEFGSCIIASGAIPARIPSINIDGIKILTSDEILDLVKLPFSLLVVGGGVIGMEFACIFHALGSKVTVVEALPRILPNEDEDISGELTKYLTRNGMAIKTGVKVTVQDIEAHEKVLVAVGRTMNSFGLNLGKAGIQSENNGRIIVNDRMQTNIKGIYAIGDVTGGLQLAHKASQEGLVAAQNIMGRDSKIDYSVIPSCIYSIPEVASAGITEKKARELGFDVGVGKFPFIANGRAKTTGETFGMVKTVVDKKTGRLLGTHIIGYEASELISESSLAIKLEATVDEFERIIHPHPTMGEAVAESVRSAVGEAIDIPNK